MKFLHNLRQKPDSYKKTFALFVSGGISAAIFVAWGISMLYSATSGEIAQKTAKKDVSPFAVITDQFGTLIAQFKNQTAGLSFLKKEEGTTTVEAVSVSPTSDSTIEPAGEQPLEDSSNDYATSSQVAQ